jgi:hypothetical protein
MALLKYTGNIDLSRNSILDILKIQGPDFYEGLSNNLEITTKDETERGSGSLVLRSGGGTTAGNVYLFAGKSSTLTDIKGVTLSTSEILVSHDKVTEEFSESLTRKARQSDTLVTYSEVIETAVDSNDKSRLDSSKGFTATSNTTYTLNAINAFILNAGKKTTNSNKTFSYPLEIKTSEDDYSKASIKTSTLNATSSLDTPIANIGSYATVGNASNGGYVDIGAIRVKYDSSSQSLIFGAV